MSLQAWHGFLGMSVLLACRIENPDHCLHKADDPHAWCKAEFDGERPFCSPCEADTNGCVPRMPSEKACPAYEPPMEEEDDETGEGSTGSDES